MFEFETGSTPGCFRYGAVQLSACDADLVILRVIPGKSGSEYWTLRCIGCGGIHLDIVKKPVPVALQPNRHLTLECRHLTLECIADGCLRFALDLPQVVWLRKLSA